MTRREVAFLLIGLAFGLMFAVAGILEVLSSLYRSSFISNFSWSRLLVVGPIVLFATGFVLLVYRPKSKRDLD